MREKDTHINKIFTGNILKTTEDTQRDLKMSPKFCSSDEVRATPLAPEISCKYAPQNDTAVNLYTLTYSNHILTNLFLKPNTLLPFYHT